MRPKRSYFISFVFTQKQRLIIVALFLNRDSNERVLDANDGVDGSLVTK